MIFARDKSQMCNNLLQYAHVYAWGREHGRKVISMRFSYKYQYFHICHTPLTGFFWYLFAKYMAALKLLPTASFKHSNCDREALERKMLRHRHIVVSGWHARWYDLFLKYRQEICELFRIDEQYTEPVRQQMGLPQPLQRREASPDPSKGGEKAVVRLGVHIRRGDYAQWVDGRYFYDNETYARHINRFAQLIVGHASKRDNGSSVVGEASKLCDKEVHVYLSTNDAEVSESLFQQLCPATTVHHLHGNAPQDLFMLSECDYLIGPPSTFSLVAAMYRDIPLYRMDDADEGKMTREAFHLFDYWFRRII